MKKLMKKASGQIAGLWGKSKQVPTAPAVQIKRLEPTLADKALAKYSGDPAIVAAHAAWGAGRLTAADISFEQRAAKTFNLAADKIVGVLGCGTGAAAVHIASHLSTFVYGYDWRPQAEVAGVDVVKASEHRAKILLQTINLETVLPPKRKCSGLLAVEPVMTRFRASALDWLRMAVVGGGQIVLEEPSSDQLGAVVPGAKWFADMQNEDCFWQSPGDREAALKQAGFDIQHIQETTGSALRALRLAQSAHEAAHEELLKAIELAQILEPVREFFTNELVTARNRLDALETGDVAVYRYRAIKQRVDG